jgi:hypothetical protein
MGPNLNMELLEIFVQDTQLSQSFRLPLEFCDEKEMSNHHFFSLGFSNPVHFVVFAEPVSSSYPSAQPPLARIFRT